MGQAQNTTAIAVARELAGFIWALVRQVPMAAQKRIRTLQGQDHTKMNEEIITVEARGAASIGRTHEESIMSVAYKAMTSGNRLKKVCSHGGQKIIAAYKTHLISHKTSGYLFQLKKQPFLEALSLL